MEIRSQDSQVKNQSRFAHKAVSSATAPWSILASTESTTSIGPICPTDNGTTYTTVHKEPYELYCNTDFSGSDLPTVHANSYVQCIEQCDTYLALSNQTGGALCVALVYWATNPNNGNCYLKYEVPLSNVIMDDTQMHGARRVQYAFNEGPVYVPFIVAPTETSKYPSTPTVGPKTTSAPQTVSAPPKSPEPALSLDAKIAIGVSIAVVGLALIVVPALFFRKKRDGYRLAQPARIISSDRPSDSEPSSDSLEKKSNIDVLEAARKAPHGDDTTHDSGSICELPAQLPPQLDPLHIHEGHSTAPPNEDIIVIGETQRAGNQMLDTIMEVTEDQTANISSPPPNLTLKLTPATPPKTHYNSASEPETVIASVSPMSKSTAHFSTIGTELSPVSSPEPSPRAIVQDENALSSERKRELVSKAKRSRRMSFLQDTGLHRLSS